MKVREHLSSTQVHDIADQLRYISATWSDLWMMIFLTKLKASRLLTIKFTQVINGELIFPNENISIKLSPSVIHLIKTRKFNYPSDIYLFQSHSNRIKKKHKLSL